VVYFEQSENNANSTRFLLAQLHLESFTGKRSPKAIRAALKNLATGSGAYDHAYEDCMERINGQVKDQEELAKQVLSWITCAQRPLTTTELQHALGVEVGESKLDEENLPDVEDIVSACAGLVTIDKESGIIRLVHYTTQDYFERTQKQWFPDAHTNITTICVTYLSFDEFENGICLSDEEFEQRLQLHKLYDYAAHNWGYHARTASTTCQGVIEFLQKQGQVKASSQVLIAVKIPPAGAGYDSWRAMFPKYSQGIPKQMTGLHLAAYFGVDDAVQFLLSCYSPDIRDSYSQTPLHWASREGHLEVAQLLLDKGADVKATNSNCGGTPLHLASREGHLEVAQLLLDEGADVKAADSDGRPPLHWASRNRHLEVAKLLLDKGADVEVADSNEMTLLFWASHYSDLKMTQLLLDKGADVENTAPDGRTPLHFASSKGDLEIAKLLLDKGADIEAKDSVSRTPLLYAARNGNKAIVELLLATNRVDVDSGDYYNSTPLSVATRMGHKDIVTLLLTKSHAFNVQDIFGRTPLWWARRTGYPEIADLLLQKCKEEGIIVQEGDLPQEDDVPTATISVPTDYSSRYCDICVLGLPWRDVCYYCSVCNHGCSERYYICKECFALKAHCLDESHILIQETE
jgi:ankyrin repeat protein